MLTAYAILSALSICLPLVVCGWLTRPTVRFLLPKRLTSTWNHKKHDGLMAAVFLLMLNRFWLGIRPRLFGARIDAMQPWEMPYLNVALAWGLISIGFVVLILYGYRRSTRSDRD